jgi:negative regulator of flagellin synthesis FlgM
MANPVNNNPRPGVGIAATPHGKPAQASTPDNSAAPGAVSRGAADASTESGRLQQIRERIDSTPDLDMKRVEDIKLALAEGRLSLDPERIAQKFASLEGLLNS